MGLLTVENKGLTWPANPILWCILPLWRGQTVVLLGGGTQDSNLIDSIRGKARVIAINDAYKLAPWADILYGCDAKWWNWHNPAFPEPKGDATTFAGIKVGLKWNAMQGKYYGGWDHENYPDIRALAATGLSGLEIAPNALRTGGNSGYQAINLAVHMGAKRILLLGYDMQKTANGAHWFGEHPDGVEPSWMNMLLDFPSLVKPLKEKGVEVINCTLDSALKVFPSKQLEAVL